MLRSKVFAAQRDGRIRVKLNDSAREFLDVVVEAVLRAESDSEHAWHESLHRPITPEVESDDPLRVFERQQILESNAGVMKETLSSPTISLAEAWAWLATLQVALRARCSEAGVSSDDDLLRASGEERETIHALQFFLFELTSAMV